MKRRIQKIAPICLGIILGAVASDVLLDSMSRQKPESALPTIGDVETLLAAYDRWKATVSHRGGDRELRLALNYSKGLSTEFTKSSGRATLDLVDGSLEIEVSQLPDTRTYDVWLVDNRSGQSVEPEPEDSVIRIGTLEHEIGKATLRAQLEAKALGGFRLDLIAVTPAGKTPAEARVLVGSPSLFQRLYYNEERGIVAMAPATEGPEANGSGYRSLWTAPFRALIPTPAYAQKKKTTDSAALARLIARGEDLFFKETFNGNGRTCGTCHPAENNLTIDPIFIAKLPPNDPLFVAEFIPALNFEKNGGARFEDPELMRKFGLIVENVDGFPEPPTGTKFTMRGVPHTLGMSLSLDPSVGDGTTVPPVQRTGWSGDGAPNNGSLRQFAVGAVIQHFPLTTKRRPGIDFRLPREDELDAMEAFQLSLGRQRELNLANISFTGKVPARGKELFLNEAKCNFCHLNAGANVSLPPGPTNSNFNTGVEALVDQPARSVKSFPIDGGFGRLPENGDGSFGNGTFNTPSLVEAADTGPFFHNNATRTIEGAVAFYNGDAFNNSPAGLFLASIDPNGVAIRIDATQVEAVAAFLRVINAVENIRASIALDGRALRMLGSGRKVNIKSLLRQSHAEIQDAIRVLREVGLHLDAVAHLERARRLIKKASNTPSRPLQEDLIQQAIREQQIARNLMVEKT